MYVQYAHMTNVPYVKFGIFTGGINFIKSQIICTVLSKGATDGYHDYLSTIGFM